MSSTDIRRNSTHAHVVSLRAAAMVFGISFVVHNADHARRGLGVVQDGVIWAGTFNAVLAAVVVTLIATRHPTAPMASAVGGFSMAFGVAASHLLPNWGPVSDSLAADHADALSWIAVSGEIAGALLLGLAGLTIMRRNAYHGRTDW